MIFTDSFEHTTETGTTYQVEAVVDVWNEQRGMPFVELISLKVFDDKGDEVTNEVDTDVLVDIEEIAFQRNQDVEVEEE